MANSSYGYMADLIIFCLIFCQMVVTYLEHKQFFYVNECGVGMFFGYLGGLMMYYCMDKATMNFDKNFFFFVLLPIVIFSEGYLIKKRYFFGYIFYISLFGIFGTLVTTLILYLLNLCVDSLGFIYANGEIVHMSTYQIFIFSTVLASSETLAAKAFVDSQARPKMYNILYGEQTMNDIVVFSFVVGALNILSENIEDQTIYWYTYLEFLAFLIFEIIVTALIGLFFGLLVTLITKTMRFLLHTDQATCAFILYCGYISFAISKSFNLAGVMSVLVCAVVVSHYMVYNISVEAQQLTIGAVKTLAYGCEQLIFFYLGVVVSQVELEFNTISWSFIAIELVILVIARFGMVFGCAGLVKLCKIKTDQTFELNGYELTFISAAGLIRGSIVFALIQYVHYPHAPEGHAVEGHEPTPPDHAALEEYDKQIIRIDVLKTTALFMVFFTTYIFGALLKPIASYCLVKSERQKAHAHAQGQAQAQGNEQHQKKETDKAKKKLVKQLSSQKDSKFKVWFKTFDQKVLKGFLIFEYEKRKDQLKEEKSKYKEQKHEEHAGHGEHGAAEHSPGGHGHEHELSHIQGQPHAVAGNGAHEISDDNHSFQGSNNQLGGGHMLPQSKQSPTRVNETFFQDFRAEIALSNYDIEQNNGLAVQYVATPDNLVPRQIGAGPNAKYYY